jgi:hypothetical protein
MQAGGAGIINSTLERQTDVRAGVNVHGRGSFDRAVCTEPLAFAVDAVGPMGVGFGFGVQRAAMRAFPQVWIRGACRVPFPPGLADACSPGLGPKFSSLLIIDNYVET